MQSQILQRFSHDLLYFFQLMASSNLSGSRYHQRLAALRMTIDNSEVPPSATSQSSAPLFHGTVATSIVSIPRIKRTRDKQFLGSSFDNGVGKNGTGLFASASSTPFDKIGKNGFPSSKTSFDGFLVITVVSVGCQVDVVNGTQFYYLIGRRTRRFLHGLFRWIGFSWVDQGKIKRCVP